MFSSKFHNHFTIKFLLNIFAISHIPFNAILLIILLIFPLPLANSLASVLISSPFDNFRIECPQTSGAQRLAIRMVESQGQKRQDTVFVLSCQHIVELYPWLSMPDEVADVEREDCHYTQLFDILLDKDITWTCKDREYIAGIARLSDTRIQIECCRMRTRDESMCIELEYAKPIGSGSRLEIEYQAKLINAISIDDDLIRVRFCDLAPRQIDAIMAEASTTKRTTISPFTYRPFITTAATNITPLENTPQLLNSPRHMARQKAALEQIRQANRPPPTIIMEENPTEGNQPPMDEIGHIDEAPIVEEPSRQIKFTSDMAIDAQPVTIQHQTNSQHQFAQQHVQPVPPINLNQAQPNAVQIDKNIQQQPNGPQIRINPLNSIQQGVQQIQPSAGQPIQIVPEIQSGQENPPKLNNQSEVPPKFVSREIETILPNANQQGPENIDNKNEQQNGNIHQVAIPAKPEISTEIDQKIAKIEANVNIPVKNAEIPATVGLNEPQNPMENDQKEEKNEVKIAEKSLSQIDTEKQQNVGQNLVHENRSISAPSADQVGRFKVHGQQLRTIQFGRIVQAVQEREKELADKMIENEGHKIENIQEREREENEQIDGNQNWNNGPENVPNFNSTNEEINENKEENRPNGNAENEEMDPNRRKILTIQFPLEGNRIGNSTEQSPTTIKTTIKSNLLIRRKGMHEFTITLKPPRVGEPIERGIAADRQRQQAEMAIQSQLDAIRQIEKSIQVEKNEENEGEGQNNHENEPNGGEREENDQKFWVQTPKNGQIGGEGHGIWVPNQRNGQIGEEGHGFWVQNPRRTEPKVQNGKLNEDLTKENPKPTEPNTQNEQSEDRIWLENPRKNAKFGIDDAVEIVEMNGNNLNQTDHENGEMKMLAQNAEIEAKIDGNPKDNGQKGERRESNGNEDGNERIEGENEPKSEPNVKNSELELVRNNENKTSQMQPINSQNEGHDKENPMENVPPGNVPIIEANINGIDKENSTQNGEENGQNIGIETITKMAELMQNNSTKNGEENGQNIGIETITKMAEIMQNNSTKNIEVEANLTTSNFVDGEAMHRILFGEPSDGDQRKVEPIPTKQNVGEDAMHRILFGESSNSNKQESETGQNGRQNSLGKKHLSIKKLEAGQISPHLQTIEWGDSQRNPNYGQENTAEKPNKEEQNPENIHFQRGVQTVQFGGDGKIDSQKGGNRPIQIPPRQIKEGWRGGEKVYSINLPTIGGKMPLNVVGLNAEQNEGKEIEINEQQNAQNQSEIEKNEGQKDGGKINGEKATKNNGKNAQEFVRETATIIDEKIGKILENRMNEKANLNLKEEGNNLASNSHGIERNPSADIAENSEKTGEKNGQKIGEENDQKILKNGQQNYSQNEGQILDENVMKNGTENLRKLGPESKEDNEENDTKNRGENQNETKESGQNDGAKPVEINDQFDLQNQNGGRLKAINEGDNSKLAKGPANRLHIFSIDLPKNHTLSENGLMNAQQNAAIKPEENPRFWQKHAESRSRKNLTKIDGKSLQIYSIDLNKLKPAKELNYQQQQQSPQFMPNFPGGQFAQNFPNNEKMSESLEVKAADQSVETMFPMEMDRNQRTQKELENLQEASSELLHSIAGMMENRQKASKTIGKIKENIAGLKERGMAPSTSQQSAASSREFADTMFREIEEHEKAVKESMELLSQLGGMANHSENHEKGVRSALGNSEFETILPSSSLPVENLDSSSTPQFSLFTSPQPLTNLTLFFNEDAESQSKVEDISVENENNKEHGNVANGTKLEENGSTNGTAKMDSLKREEAEEDEEYEEEGAEEGNTKETELKKVAESTTKDSKEPAKMEENAMNEKMPKIEENAGKKNSTENGNNFAKARAKAAKTHVKKKAGKASNSNRDNDLAQFGAELPNGHGVKHGGEREEENGSEENENAVPPPISPSDLPPLDAFPSPPPSNRAQGPSFPVQLPQLPAKEEKGRQQQFAARTLTEKPAMKAGEDYDVAEDKAKDDDGMDEKKIGKNSPKITKSPEDDEPTSTVAIATEITELTTEIETISTATAKSRYPSTTRLPLYKRRQLDRHALQVFGPAAFDPTDLPIPSTSPSTIPTTPSTSLPLFGSEEYEEKPKVPSSPRRIFPARKPRPPKTPAPPILSANGQQSTGLPDEETDQSPFDAERAQLLKRLRQMHRMNFATGKEETSREKEKEGKNSQEKETKEHENEGQKMDGEEIVHPHSTVQNLPQQKQAQRQRARGRFERPSIEESRFEKESPFDAKNEAANSRRTSTGGGSEIRRKPSIDPSPPLEQITDSVDSKMGDVGQIHQPKDGTPMFSPTDNRPMKIPTSFMNEQRRNSSRIRVGKRPSSQLMAIEAKNGINDDGVIDQDILVPMNNNNNGVAGNEDENNAEGVKGNSSTMAMANLTSTTPAPTNLTDIHSASSKRPLINAQQINSQQTMASRKAQKMAAAAADDYWAFWTTKTTVAGIDEDSGQTSTTTNPFWNADKFFRLPNRKTQSRQPENVLTFCSKSLAIRDHTNLPIACAGEDGEVWSPPRCPPGTGCLPAADSAFYICCPVANGRRKRRR